MEFTFDTAYTLKAMTALTRALRKTLRQKKSVRSRILGGVLIVLAVALTLPLDGGAFTMDLNTLLNWAIALILLLVLIFEDVINGFVARRRTMAGLRSAKTVFDEEKYTSITDVGKSEFYYNSNIHALAETDAYFIFLFDASHGQVFEKSSLTGGSQEDFRRFMKEKIGKEFVRI